MNEVLNCESIFSTSRIQVEILTVKTPTCGVKYMTSIQLKSFGLVMKVINGRLSALKDTARQEAFVLAETDLLRDF